MVDHTDTLVRHVLSCEVCFAANVQENACSKGKVLILNAKIENAPRPAKVSLTKPVQARPSEWELDRRRTVINPTLSTLNGHRDGLNANDSFALNSAFKTLASIHPRSHAWNRQTLGRDAQMWAGHLS